MLSRSPSCSLCGPPHRRPRRFSIDPSFADVNPTLARDETESHTTKVLRLSERTGFSKIRRVPPPDFAFIYMKILIVDDHPVLRDGVATLLRQDHCGMVDIQASNADDAMRLLEQHSDLDVIVLDLKMSGMDGFAAIAAIAQVRPELPIIVLSSSEDPHDVRAAFTHGALGYIPKSATAHTLLSAIKMVMNGEHYVPPLLLEAQSAHRDPPPAHEPDGPRLTLRQLDVLRLIAEGVPNKLIADRLGLSEKTVKAHITAIFKALHVRNRTQAAAAGQRLGLL
ncbi:response regulator [Burkholderia territorii]|uniref:response regulator n=1 Tax=Burkholderia territorii TaxID=1503055 RepID=UPI001E5F4C9B|nr:response regulator transcription factor [Burkholderia territorii]